MGPKPISITGCIATPSPLLCKKGSHYSRLYSLIYRVLAGKNMLNILNVMQKIF